MRFKLDENLPHDAVLLLREAGHDAVSVLEQDLGGESDDQLAAICREEQRALVTLDADIVIRLAQQDRPNVFKRSDFYSTF